MRKGPGEDHFLSQLSKIRVLGWIYRQNGRWRGGEGCVSSGTRKRWGSGKLPQKPKFMENRVRKGSNWRSLTTRGFTRRWQGFNQKLTLIVVCKVLVQCQKSSNRIWMSVFIVWRLFKCKNDAKLCRNVSVAILYHVWVNYCMMGCIPKNGT